MTTARFELKSQGQKVSRLPTEPLAFITVGVEKRGEYYLVHGDLPRQHPFETTLRFTGPVPADSRQ